MTHYVFLYINPQCILLRISDFAAASDTPCAGCLVSTGRRRTRRGYSGVTPHRHAALAQRTPSRLITYSRCRRAPGVQPEQLTASRGEGNLRRSVGRNRRGRRPWWTGRREPGCSRVELHNYSWRAQYGREKRISVRTFREYFDLVGVSLYELVQRRLQ